MLKENPLLSFQTNCDMCLPLLIQVRCIAQSWNHITNQSHSCDRRSTFQILGAAGNRKERSGFFCVFFNSCDMVLHKTLRSAFSSREVVLNPTNPYARHHPDTQKTRLREKQRDRGGFMLHSEWATVL